MNRVFCYGSLVNSVSRLKNDWKGDDWDVLSVASWGGVCEAVEYS